MRLTPWMDLLQAEAEDPVDAKASLGTLTLTDEGDDRTLDSPSKGDEPADEDAGPEKSGDSGSEPPDEPAAGEPDGDESVDPETVSDELLERADALGYTASDVLKFRSIKTLTAAIERDEEMKARFDRVAARKAKSEPEEKVAEEPDEFSELEAKLAQMLEDGYDEGQIAALRQAAELAKKSDQRSKLLEAKLNEITEAHQQEAIDRANEIRQQRFDAVLEKMSKDYPDTFGEGPGSKLDQDSPEFKNRDEVWKRYHVIEAGYHAVGLKAPPAETMIREAAAAAFSTKAQQLARKKLVSDIKSAGNQTIPRARHSEPKPLEGDEAALVKTREFLAKNA